MAEKVQNVNKDLEKKVADLERKIKQVEIICKRLMIENKRLNSKIISVDAEQRSSTHTINELKRKIK